jgi:Gram-negative bacterial TonB protein C-terminal
MSTTWHHKIVETAGDCISEAQMLDYIDKRLRPDEMHRIEKHLLDCELCADALEGLTLLKNRGRLTITRQKVKEKLILHEMPIDSEMKGRVISFNYKRCLAIAASLLILFAGYWWFSYYFKTGLITTQNLAVTTTTSDIKREKDKLMESRKEAVIADSAVLSGVDAKEVTTKSEPLPMALTDITIEQQQAKAEKKRSEETIAPISTTDIAIKRDEEQKDLLTVAPTVADKAEGNTVSLSANKASADNFKSIADSTVQKELKFAATKNNDNTRQMPAKALSTNAETLESTNKVADRSEPKFSYNNQSVNQYIKNKIVLSDELKSKGIKGAMLITGTVDENGVFEKFKVKEGLGAEINAAVLKALSEMPHWEPATKDGKPISKKVSFTIQLQ